MFVFYVETAGVRLRLAFDVYVLCVFLCDRIAGCVFIDKQRAIGLWESSLTLNEERVRDKQLEFFLYIDSVTGTDTEEQRVILYYSE